MKYKYPRLLLVLSALMLSVSSLWAERVSQEDAALVAANFFSAPDTTQGDTTQAAQAARRSRKVRRVALADEAQYYVYANADGEGWVMVAANDVVQPILAYSETGTFRTVNMPSNVKSWMGGYNKQINYAEANGLEATEETKAEWTALRKGARKAKAAVVVSPLIKTGWDQDEPYWNLCPSKNSNRCYTGCVATAMAQVMNYHQWPKTGTGSHSLTYNGKTYTANFGETTYDWANMKNTYSSSSSSTSKTAVATLMYHCGIAVDMSYGTSSEGGSAAYTIDFNGYFTRQGKMCAETALTTFFGYNSSTVTGYYRNGDNSTGMKKWTESEWIAMLKEELDDSRPIMYAGGDSQGETGHSFVCDGYDSDNKFHFNWGWGNYCDGYYSVNSLVPAASGSGGGNGDYSYDQDVIIGIMPPQVGHNVVLNGTGCTLVASTKMVENGNSLNVTITPTDETYDHSSITVKLGSTTISSSNYSLTNSNKTLTIDGSAITGDSSNDLTITIVWTKNRYKYELLGDNCTAELSGMLAKNAALSLTITPASGYTLADAACWEVTMGGNTLMYGTGFTYSGTTFSIAKVTGDVEIYAYGGKQVSWYANGSLHTTNMSISDKITLPTDPADCSGSNGKKFVGWCTISDYSDATTSPIFAKDGDDYTVATYYAVYATAGSGAPRRAKQASATYNKVTSGTITDGQYLIVYESGNVAFDGSRSTLDAASNTIAITISSSAITGDYEANEFSIDASKGTIKSASGYYIGQTANNNGMNTSTSTAYTNTLSISDGNFSVLSSGGAYLRYNSNSDQARFRYFRSSSYTSQKAIQLYKKAGSGGGGDSGGSGDYTDYSTACGTPCSNNPTMSFSPATVDKTTADEPFTKTVTITDKGSGQTVAYSSSNVTVATVDNSGNVTLKGVVGSTTITASVSADGDYCAASASYTLTVTAAPINVTLYYNGTSASLTNQTNPYTLPTGSPYNAAMCDGDWTFAGWYGSEYAKSTTAPTYISQLTSTGSAYAVYTTTETSGSSGSTSVTKTMESFSEISGYVDNDENISYAAAQGNATTAPVVNSSQIRIYQNGGLLTITANNEKKLTSVTIGSGMSTTVAYSIDSGEDSSNKNITSGGKLTVDDLDATTIRFTCKGTSSTTRLYLNYLSVTYSSNGGGSTTTTYYATSPNCPVACELTGITLNTDNVKKTFVTNETFTSEGMVVTASYDNCVDATVTPTSVSTPVMSSVGEKTVTVSYTEGNVTKTATYKINVVAPYTVTYMACGEEFTTQTYAPGATLVLPTETPEDNAGKSFVGWINSPSYTNKTTAPTFVTAGSAVNANATYYAVYQ